MQQMPARAEIVSQLGQSAEVQMHYSASRLMADMFVFHISDQASDMTTLCCMACLLGVNAQSSSTRRGLLSSREHVASCTTLQIWYMCLFLNIMSSVFHEVGVAVQAAEQLRKGVIDRALLVMTHAMNDIAHLSPGEVERLIEHQAIELNLSMLDNR